MDEVVIKKISYNDVYNNTIVNAYFNKTTKKIIYEAVYCINDKEKIVDSIEIKRDTYLEQKENMAEFDSFNKQILVDSIVKKINDYRDEKIKKLNEENNKLFFN